MSRLKYNLDRWQFFLALTALLIGAGALRSAWATGLDGFTFDEPWHITAGVAYLRTGEYYLNPEHPPLVKLVAASALRASAFQFVVPNSLRDKIAEREFISETVYTLNDADRVQSRVRLAMYLFNGLLLLLFALATFKSFGGAVALGALMFVLVDPTVAAHWPVVMTDLPVALLSVTGVLLCVEALRSWAPATLCLLAIVLGLTLSVKHSGLIAYGFVAGLGFFVLFWQSRKDWRTGLKRSGIFLLTLAGALAILWGMYCFRYNESGQPDSKFNRPLAQKISDLRSPIWRFGLVTAVKWRLLPRSYVWGLADTVHAGMEGRAWSTYAFGRLSFMQRRPFIFPGYILVRLPIALLLLSLFGSAVAFRSSTPIRDKLALTPLLLFAGAFLVILARSGADYAGVRHALSVYVVLAITAGFAIRSLAQDRRRIVGLGALGLCLAACFPALAVMRPWEYHNILGGGTGQAYRYFRNDGVDLSQRDKEIARYYHRNLEPRGEVPYLIYYTPKADLDYRGVNAKSLLDPDENDLPPATISGTLIVASTTVAPAIWSDFPALRNATPVDRMGNVLVYRGKYYLPGVRADALFSRVDKLLAEQQPDLTEVESLLREGLSLRTNDFPGWMRLGNILLLRGERVQSIAAYQKARDSVPPSPVRQMFEDQIRLMSTKPLESITPMRNPSTE